MINFEMNELMNRPLTTFFCLIIAILASACSAPAATPTAAVMETSDYQTVLASDDFAVGQPRVPFVLYDGTEKATDVAAIAVELFDLTDDPPTRVWEGTATNYTDYEVPYWVIYPEIPATGFWGLGLTVTRQDGSQTQTTAVLSAAETSAAPAVGDLPPASENRTLETEPDITKLTSGRDPVPALYQTTVAEALASGRPSVVTFSTPAFCTSELCAPVLDSVEAVHSVVGEAANFIHLEIYKTFEPLETADEVTEWNLTSEPWTFVLDRAGNVAAKFGGPVSPRELQTALDPLLEAGG